MTVVIIIIAVAVVGAAVALALVAARRSSRLTEPFDEVDPNEIPLLEAVARREPGASAALDEYRKGQQEDERTEADIEAERARNAASRPPR